MFLLSHFIDQTREFAHHQYCYTHRRSRLMHNREQKRNHSNTKFFSIENLSKNVIFKNEIIRIRSFSRCQKFDFAISLRKSFEHEILLFVWFEAHSSTSYLLLVWSHRDDLKNHYRRDFRIWQIRIDRNVCKNRRKHIALRCFERRFSRERSSRIELYVKFCLFLSRRSRIQIYWNLFVFIICTASRMTRFLKWFIVCIAIHVVAFAHSSKRTTKFFAFTFAQSERRRVYTMFHEMYDSCLNTL